ncbi:uncharacterized protein LOC107607096 [Arachis ipaensis]|uniref:uncharacterized protein LOC107607096 n=1 Tax=Arachis ipaensis TaxID=130454 RepID=UPI0007AF7E26|nr:uncharacterized protein LOC107607096 [Arachis ipaensis]
MLAGVCGNDSHYEWDDRAVIMVEGLQGDGAANVGANDAFIDGANSENSEVNEELANKSLETNLSGGRIRDREGYLREEGNGMDDEDRDNNCSRGLRGDGKCRMVKDLRRKHRLNMLGVVETKMQTVTRFDVLKFWGNDAGWEYVESIGASGGILLIWDDVWFKRKNCYKGERWLCVEGVFSENNVNCAFFLVYGAHTRDEKLVVWKELSYVARLCQCPYCFLGDFNEIVQVEERRGYESLPLSAEDFKNWINDMDLVDLPITDQKFTWFRGWSCSRIDRALRPKDGPRPFRSLDSWFTHEGFLRLVKEEWIGLGEVRFTDKLKALSVPMKRWHRDKFGDMDNKIMKFEKEIKKIDDMVGDREYDGTVEARRWALVASCEKWYVRKELHWKQMSRSSHARYMDKNTRYFHNLASARRRNNRIDALVINGRLIRNQARIKLAIRGFYKELYHQEKSPKVGFRDGLVKMISEEDALALERLSTPEEVREAV